MPEQQAAAPRARAPPPRGSSAPRAAPSARAGRRARAIDVALGGGDRQLRADRRGALGDARQHLDAVEAHADRAAARRPRRRRTARSALRRSRADRPPSTGTAGWVSARWRSTGSVGKLSGSGSSIAASAPSRSGMPDREALVGLLDRLGVERGGRAAAERGRPDRHGGAVLDLAAVAEHAARAAAGELVRARAPRATPSSVASGAARWAPEAKTTARSGRCAAERPPRLRAPPRSPRPRGSGCVERPQPTRTAMLRTILAQCLRFRVIALFGPTGVGKTDVAIALAARLRARGEDPVAVSADALQVYRGPRGAHRRRRARASGPARAPARRASCRSTRRFSVGPVRRARARRDRRAARARAGARSSSAAPASTCAPRSPTSTCARRRPRASASAWRPSSTRAGAQALHAELRARARRGPPRAIEPDRPPPHRARARAARRRRARAARRRALAALDRATRAIPTLLVRPDDGPRGAVRAHRRARGRDGRGGRRRGGARGARRRRVGDRAQGARLRGAARRRRRGDEAAHAQLRPAPAHVDAQARRRAS